MIEEQENSASFRILRFSLPWFALGPKGQSNAVLTWVLGGASLAFARVVTPK